MNRHAQVPRTPALCAGPYLEPSGKLKAPRPCSGSGGISSSGSGSGSGSSFFLGPILSGGPFALWIRWDAKRSGEFRSVGWVGWGKRLTKKTGTNGCVSLFIGQDEQSHF